MLNRNSSTPKLRPRRPKFQTKTCEGALFSLFLLCCVLYFVFRCFFYSSSSSLIIIMPTIITINKHHDDVCDCIYVCIAPYIYILSPEISIDLQQQNKTSSTKAKPTFFKSSSIHYQLLCFTPSLHHPSVNV